MTEAEKGSHEGSRVVLTEKDIEVVQASVEQSWIVKKLSVTDSAIAAVEAVLAHREAVSQPSEPVGLVKKMLDEFWPLNQVGIRSYMAMERALKIAQSHFDQQLQQKLSERDKEWEQALKFLGEQGGWLWKTADIVIERCRARLCRKKEPSLQERVVASLTKFTYGGTAVEDAAADIIALVRAEIGEEK